MRALHRRLSGALLAILVVCGGAFLMLGARTSDLYQLEVQQRLNADLAAHIVKHYPLIRAREVNREALEELFEMLMVINPAIEVYLLDPAGEILAYEAPAGRVERTRVALAPIERLLGGTAILPVLGDDPRDTDGSKAFSAAPIRSTDELDGYLYVVLGGEAYTSIAAALAGSYALRLGARVGLLIIAVCLLAALVSFRRLTRPLMRLDRRMARFAASELGARVGPAGVVDEVARLEATFSHMADRIREQIRELEHVDRQRRELVASVSHDLRTPLTHLQGYLDTLRLKGERLSPAERDEYLGIALRHAERLGRLLDDLFELAKLDALEAPVQVERFALAELVGDVVAKRRLTAQRLGVALQTNITAGTGSIEADPSLLERALDNLIDNALRHTPPGGTVEVSATRGPDGVVIRVRDSGEGIPEDEHERIFERFYRVGPSSSTDGSGLGLAIARRAAELHRGTIRVESAPGRGSVFGLLLPASGIRQPAAT